MMFEAQSQSEIDALIKASQEFKELYQRHKLLDKKCMDAELGVLPISDVTLSQMKREKLFAKMKLIRLYEQRPPLNFLILITMSLAASGELFPCRSLLILLCFDE